MWSALENITGLKAVPAVWRRQAGASFGPFAAAFLRQTGETAESFPCGDCGCFHRVVEDTEESQVERCAGGGARVPVAAANYTAVCDCECGCRDIALTSDDVQLWELDWERLGHAITRAFGADLRDAEIGCRGARQIGAFGAMSMPIVLVIQHDRTGFRTALAQLMARLRSRFIVLAPTNRFVDAVTHELLLAAGAGFFDLASHLTFFPRGVLHSRKTAGELFTHLLPEAAPADEDVARQALAMLQRLDSGPALASPSLLTVFRLYCVEELTAEQVARRCKCAKGTVINRLKALRAGTGMAPAALRRLSGHFERMEEEMRDPRARGRWRET